MDKIDFRHLLNVIEHRSRQKKDVDVRLEAAWSGFRAAIRARRQECGIPLKTLAMNLGIKKSLLSYLETGKRQWSMEVARAAVAALK